MCDESIDRVELLLDDGFGQFHFVTDSARSGRGWLIEAYVGQGRYLFLWLKLIEVYTQVVLKSMYCTFLDLANEKF